MSSGRASLALRWDETRAVLASSLFPLDIYMSMYARYDLMTRTTVRLPDELLAAAQARARDTGRTFTDLVADALRYELRRTAQPRRVAEPLPVYRGRGLQPGVDIADASALADLMGDG